MKVYVKSVETCSTHHTMYNLCLYFSIDEPRSAIDDTDMFCPYERGSD